MKRFAPSLAALLCVLAFAAPAQAQVELEEVALSPRLASTVTTIQPQCYYCDSLTVTAFDVLSPSSGPLSHDDAAWAAIEYLGAWYYDPGTRISQSGFDSAMANRNYEELPPELRTFVNPSDTSWTVSESSWSYMTAPDYCSAGHFYTLVFHQSRKVVTVEITSGHEC